MPASQASPVWNTTISSAYRPPNSRRTVATAAIHGVYNKVKVRNDAAANGVKIPPKIFGRVATLPPVSTANVLTTASFAVKPVTNAVEARQSAKPNGPNMGATHSPNCASRLPELSATTFKRLSKVCKNHIIMVAKKITVKALVKKSFALSHNNNATLDRKSVV